MVWFISVCLHCLNSTDVYFELCDCGWNSSLIKLTLIISKACLRVIILVVYLPSHVWLFTTPWTATCQASLSLTISQSLPEFMSIAPVMPSSHLILWRRLILLPSIFPSIRDFSYELALRIRWPKYWSFRFSIGPSNEYSAFISLKIDSFNLLADQGGTSSPAPWRHQFFGALPSSQSSSHNHVWPLGIP